MQLTLTLALLLTAGKPDAGVPDAGVRPAAPFSWDVPGLITMVPVGERLESGGLPLMVFAARSKWKLGELMAHYEQRFQKAGYFLPPRLKALNPIKLPKLVALDEEKMINFLVWGWPEKDGTTTLMLTAADLGHRRPVETNGLPLFPGAKNATVFNVEIATAVSFQVKATEAEVIDFYRSVLPSGGWKEREPGIFVRAGRAVQVMAKKDGDALSVVVLEQADVDVDSTSFSETEGGPGSP